VQAPLAMPTTPHPRNSTKLRVTVLQQDSLKMAACIFCKIIKGKGLFLSALLGFINDQWLGEIPSMKLFESERTFAFLDIQPLSKGHSV
jgi:hypothetical protein